MATSKAKPKSKEVKVAAAKGRPMLTWVGKRPLTHVTAFPAQHVETFDPIGELEKPRTDEVRNEWPDAYPRGGLLFHGDNKEVLAHLLANGFRGKVDLIYIDPPFDSGADYVRRVSLRGDKGTAKIEGESYTLGEQIQYTDIWANDEYLQFMYERLLLLAELLGPAGSIFVHTNQERVHLIRCLMDEVFGPESFKNDIAWKRGPGKSHPRYFGRVKDTILFYTRGADYTWNKLFRVVSEEYSKTFRKKDGKGYYVTQPLHSGHPAKNVPEWRGVRPPEGRGWAYKLATLDQFEKDGLIEWSEDSVPRLKRYLEDVEGAVIQDVWDDIDPVLDRSQHHSDFPTQKPVELADRILNACSNPQDLVLDCFVGSGTTVLSAQKLGRRWIGCDINKGAIQTTAKRLQDLIMEQVSGGAQGTLTADELRPPQLSFTTWRVNDYDLQIQHNEAVELACEHIGIQRTRTDPFFDGTLGKNLAKIIPLTHPLSPVDLEAIRNELDARPEEDRSVTLVCLGIELAAKRWIEDWNRLRRGKNAVNKIDYIELRSDPKLGGFIKHEPATARVKISRTASKVVIEIEDFISPSIIERLRRQTGITKPKIDDWKAMVDSVMIDADYDGKVLNITLSDVPTKKQDLVEGRYELEAPKKNTVAVKITDMLGEEVLITDTV